MREGAPKFKAAEKSRREELVEEYRTLKIHEGTTDRAYFHSRKQEDLSALKEIRHKLKEIANQLGPEEVRRLYEEFAKKKGLDTEKVERSYWHGVEKK